MKTLDKKFKQPINLLLDSLGSNFYICGSMALYLQGFLERPVNDIDISIPNPIIYQNLNSYFAITKRFKKYDNEEAESNDNESELKLQQFYLDNIKIDAFHTFEPFDIIEISIDDELFALKVANVKNIFKAKLDIMDDIFTTVANSSDLNLPFGNSINEKKRKDFNKHYIDLDNYFNNL